MYTLAFRPKKYRSFIRLLCCLVKDVDETARPLFTEVFDMFFYSVRNKHHSQQSIPDEFFGPNFWGKVTDGLCSNKKSKIGKSQEITWPIHTTHAKSLNYKV